MSNGFISDKGTIIGSDNSGNAIGFEETVGTACKNPNGYTVGSYFKGIEGNFYEVTATISSGATITVGTNCKRTDIATELSELNADKLNKYEQVAVSAGGKTFAQQLSELYTTWQNLSNEQKMRAFLKLDDVIYTLFNLTDGAFFMVSQDGSHVYNFYFNLRLGKFYLATDNSVSDSSNATDYSSMELYA